MLGTQCAGQQKAQTPDHLRHLQHQNIESSLNFWTCHDNKTPEEKELGQESITHAILLPGTSLTLSVQNSYPSEWCCYADKKLPMVYVVVTLRHFSCFCHSDNTRQNPLLIPPPTHTTLEGSAGVITFFDKYYLVIVLTHSYIRN